VRSHQHIRLCGSTHERTTTSQHRQVSREMNTTVWRDDARTHARTHASRVRARARGRTDFRYCGGRSPRISDPRRARSRVQSVCMHVSTIPVRDVIRSIRRYSCACVRACDVCACTRVPHAHTTTPRVSTTEVFRWMLEEQGAAQPTSLELPTNITV